MQKKHTRFFFIFLIGLFTKSQAQNLVLNAGFENYHCKHWRNASIELCDNWSSPTLGSPDYFMNSCPAYNVAAWPDQHWWGPQQPHSGQAYVGIIAYRPNDIEWNVITEYIQAALSKPLEAEQTYTVQLYVSLAECSRMTLQLGAHFYEKQLDLNNVKMLPGEPQLLFEQVRDTAGWVLLQQSYTAKGGERFVCMGLFGDRHTEKVRPSRNIYDPRGEAYFFIDDVAVFDESQPVTEVADSIVQPVAEPPAMPQQTAFEAKAGVPVVLEHVFFETGKYDLLPASYSELDKLYELLEENKTMKAEISGHTDNQGRAADNVSLSQNRAKAVYDYLLKKGIDPVRLSYKGFGNKQPVAGNDTEQGRAQNRRVEFKLIDE